MAASWIDSMLVGGPLLVSLVGAGVLLRLVIVDARERSGQDVARMCLMVVTAVAAVLILMAGLAMVSSKGGEILSISLSACVAAFGLVAAGHVLACGKSMSGRALALFFLLLNSVPVLLAVFVVGGAVL